MSQTAEVRGARWAMRCMCQSIELVPVDSLLTIENSVELDPSASISAVMVAALWPDPMPDRLIMV